MSRERNRVPFESFGADMKEARKALGFSQRVLAEMVGIDPRYLANIENSGSLPSLPVFYEIVSLCKLPVERYFYPEAGAEWNSEERERAALKLRLCPEKSLPIIEGALDAAIKRNEDNEAGDE
jgi:transcriptional regulator with XRE-family HTH domain